MSSRSVLLASPHYGSYTADALSTFIMPSFDEGTFVKTVQSGISLLANNFSRLFCDFLNDKTFTHFAMAHSDVQAPPGWLDILLAESERVKADVLSVVVPLKDGRGLTSTGWRHLETGQITRFTMKQVHEFPGTFDAVTAGVAPAPLLVNTGLWVCRRAAWCEEFPGFSIVDEIARKPDGTFTARCLSEDWNASEWWHAQGLRVFATRIVPVIHHGRGLYRNDHVWGSEEIDRGDDCTNLKG